MVFPSQIAVNDDTEEFSSLNLFNFTPADKIASDASIFLFLDLNIM